MSEQPEFNFDGAPKDKRTPGEKGRDEGMARAVNHAEKCRPGWQDDAMKSIFAYPGKEFRTEQLRAFAYAHGLDRPPTDMAWGSVMNRARRKGLVSFVAFVNCEGSETMHKQPVGLWRKL